MATTKKTRTRISPAADPTSQALTSMAKQIASAAGKPPEDVATEETSADDPIVTANVVTAFNLTTDDGSIKRYEVGANKMPRSHADHWYAKAHGVKVVD